MDHVDDCPCHRCTADRLQTALTHAWHEQFVAPLTVDLRFNFDLAAKADEHCGCGEPHMANAVEGALIDSIVGLIGSVTLDENNVLVAPAAIVLMGKVMTRFGLWLADQGVTPVAVDSEFESEAPGQNAPSTMVPQ